MAYCCGDVIARTDNLKDSIDDIDSMPPRHVLDNVVFGHGLLLIVDYVY